MKKHTGKKVVPRSAGKWAQIVGEWRRSRQQTSAFCRAHGLTLKTFQWWRWALAPREQDAQQRRRPSYAGSGASSTALICSRAPTETPGFLEVMASMTSRRGTGQPGAGVEIVLRGAQNERRVRVDSDFDQATLLRVMQVLEEV